MFQTEYCSSNSVLTAVFPVTLNGTLNVKPDELQADTKCEFRFFL